MLMRALEASLVRNTLREKPVIFEFGVASGGSYERLAKRIKRSKPQISLVGFDSFQGLPDETKGVWVPKRHAKGEFSFDMGHVQRRLNRARIWGDHLLFVPGFYEDSLVDQQSLALRDTFDQLLLVNIDVDIHKSTIELLDFCLPLIGRGTYLYFDDWKDPRDRNPEPWGEHLAWDQWTKSHPNIEWIALEIGEHNNRIILVTRV